jgi:hypothetical protein
LRPETAGPAVEGELAGEKLKTGAPAIAIAFSARRSPRGMSSIVFASIS